MASLMALFSSEMTSLWPVLLLASYQARTSLVQAPTIQYQERTRAPDDHRGPLPPPSLILLSYNLWHIHFRMPGVTEVTGVG